MKENSQTMNPLFKSEDGALIFEGDSFYHVDNPERNVLAYVEEHIASDGFFLSIPGRRFKKRQNAVKFAQEAVPLYSIADIRKALDGVSLLEGAEPLVLNDFIRKLQELPDSVPNNT